MLDISPPVAGPVAGPVGVSDVCSTSQTSSQAHTTKEGASQPPLPPLPPQDAAQEDEYRESDDEDFNPNAQEDDEDEDEDEDEKDLERDTKLEKEYAKMEGSGFIKTRSQRAQEITELEKPKVVGTQSVDVDALWAEMNSSSSQTSKPAPKPPVIQNKSDCEQKTENQPCEASAASNRIQEKYIRISQTFKFAGKIQTEDKLVLENSAEGQDYIKRQKLLGKPIPEAVSDLAAATPIQAIAAAPKRRISLDEEYAMGKAKKINTLEKSRRDWLGFVDKEGIQDDLKKFNKAGFLDKQGFLARVEHNVDSDLRANRSKFP